MDDYESILQREFAAEEGSFLLQLRTRLQWDEAAFSRLVQAMVKCAEAHEDQELIPRWIAEGFWSLETFTPQWVAHPDFAKRHYEAYYAAAFEQLRDLSYWLFVGERPPLPEADS